jgi:hypothetical protein
VSAQEVSVKGDIFYWKVLYQDARNPIREVLSIGSKNIVPFDGLSGAYGIGLKSPKTRKKL